MSNVLDLYTEVKMSRREYCVYYIKCPGNDKDVKLKPFWILDVLVPTVYSGWHGVLNIPEATHRSLKPEA